MTYESGKEALVKYLAAGDYARVLDEGGALWRGHEDRVDAAFFLLQAQAAKALDQTDDYEFYLTQAHMADPENTAVLKQRWSLYLTKKDYYNAEDCLAKYLTREPEDAIAWAHRGDVAVQRELHRDALKYYDQALSTTGLSVADREDLVPRVAEIYRALGKTTEGLAFLDKHVEGTPFNEQIERARYALLYGNAGRHPEAWKACLLRLHKGLPTALRYGLSLVDLIPNSSQKLEILTELYGRASSEKDLAKILKKRAYAYFASEEWVRAGKDCQDWLKLENTAKGHELLGEIAEKLQKKQAAITSYSEALRLDEDATQALRRRAQLYFDTEQYVAARADWLNILSWAPEYEHAALEYKLGLTCQKIEMLEEAEAYLFRASQKGHEEALAVIRVEFPAAYERQQAEVDTHWETQYPDASTNNAAHPILQALFQKLWAPDLSRQMDVHKEELLTAPKTWVEEVVKKWASQWLVFTPESLLYIVDDVPLEARYRVAAVEAGRLILEVQPRTYVNSTHWALRYEGGRLSLQQDPEELELYFQAATAVTPEMRTVLTPPNSVYLPSLTQTLAQL